MMKLPFYVAALAIAGAANAQSLILVPNGDFEAGSTSWQEVSGGGAGATYTYPSSGGNPDGYGQIDSTAGSWAIWVANMGPEVIPLSTFGVSAGDTITVSMDMIEFSSGTGTETAGIKMESWNSAVISDSGDMKVSLTNTWDTYTWDYTIAAGATGIKFVPVQHDEISVGYDNVGVAVPEPSAFSLLGGLFALGFMIRRRR